MAQTICVMGESGNGKTCSMRNLPPKETFYFDCDGKGLGWKGWKNDFNADNKNYYKTDFYQVLQTLLEKIDKEQKNIKYVVVDTINALMDADEFRRMQEKGYDKWQDLAQCVFGLIKNAQTYRDDLTIIFLAHTQTYLDENG